MAGRGSRLRPHTLTVPKPLIPLGGKPIVRRLVEEIVSVSNKKIEEIAFVIGDFGKEVEKDLLNIAEDFGAKGTIFFQKEPLGTAHAILCAKELLEGNCVVAFADTLFRADFKLDEEKDGIIWVSQIDDPSSFGVIKINEKNIITDFVEKPERFVSNLAIIGVYYFKDGNFLKNELQYLLDNDIKEKGEYQLTNALENMKKKGALLYPGKVAEWLDCGNKEATVFSNKKVLERTGSFVATSATIENSEIKHPCYIGENTVVKNSLIGPGVSIGDNNYISNSEIRDSLIQNNTTINTAKLKNSMIGNSVFFEGKKHCQEVSVGDFSEIRS